MAKACCKGVLQTFKGIGNWAMNTMNITASPLGHMSSTINILLLLAGNRLIHGSFLCRQEERRLARGREKKEAEPSIKRIKEMK